MHLLPAPQGTHADAPAGEYVPAPQLTHAVAPATFEYWPAKHQHASVQDPPPRCVSREQRACIEDTHLE